ncbi:radical SAM protein [Gabonibacter chumensis]|uniref:radical SAM protein n=1 Tax=Gabonibacter chumensis TaxID=2972474 RepID=UPI002572E992|nr:radical SAM protein [Gabonibacter chumensis]MCR9012808.1 radical SAM protein [Gabonibacter chumensis]
MGSFKNKMQAYGIRQILNYVEKDPEANAPKALKWIRKVDVDGTYDSAWSSLETCLSDPDNNWNLLIKKAYNEWDPFVRRKLFESLICNSAIIGNSMVKVTGKKHGVNVPWTILMDPTSACNLKCKGCWAAEYGHQMSLDFDTMDRIIKEGKELGIFMYIYSGGEPLVRKGDIIRLCEKHPECYFLAFTNGTLIDEAFADEMLRVGNFAPAISVEGFEKETDMRRGKGTYQAVIKAMELLKRKRLIFGYSTCYHSQNVDVVGSDEYVDFMIEKGAAFAWYFTYMPVGEDAIPELLATPEQRKYMYYQVRKFRRTKPIFAMDFWNDGEYVDGCIAGGRYYFHINANGDVEPCAFIHYSTANIKNMSLLDALRTPLFQEYQKRQPFNKNHLRPCPLLDNPDRLKEVVNAAHAHSTDMLKPESVEDLTGKCQGCAHKWAVVADQIWTERGKTLN